MKVLSLFDGISCARVALERSGIPVEAYYASEIDAKAIEVSTKNGPDIVQCGDIQNISYAKGKLVLEPFQLEQSDSDSIKTKIDLMIGGSPCQDLSIAKKGRQGLAGTRSGLFWDFVRLLEEVKPKWWVLAREGF